MKLSRVTVDTDLATVAAADAHHLWHPWSAVQPRRPRLLVTSAQGCQITDAGGRSYLDLRAGVLNAAVGYGHPQVVDALSRQAAGLMSWDLVDGTTVPAALLAERIADLAPGALTRTLFCNSGSEAVEAAVKIARGRHILAGQRDRTLVLSLRDGYHGTTSVGIAATGVPFRRTHAGPLPEGFAQIATPRCAACAAGETHTSDCEVPGAAELESAIERYRPDRVAAFLVEPVLGVGGIIVPPAGYLRAIREVCTRHDVLLIVDEVVTGFGRTGRWFGVDHDDVEPDILVTAKGLAGGYAPLSAVTVPDETFRAFAQDPLLAGLRHGHTTGGHAVACAAALTVLDIIAADRLVEHAAMVGHLLAAALEPARDIPGVRDVRGRGLLLGVELETDERASEVAAAAQDSGVLVRPFGSVLTIAPPLMITTEEAERGATVLLEACATVAIRTQAQQ